MSNNAYDQVADFIFDMSDEARNFIVQDLPRWKQHLKQGAMGDKEFLAAILKSRQEFRSLLRYRAKMLDKIFGHSGIRSSLANKMDVGPDTYVSNLYISCADIGPGFYLEHAFSTIIYAKRIGKNFWINQGVTIGTGRGGTPTIGDNVSIRTNAVVFGGITIGNDVRVGAGVVLHQSVPDGATVVPAAPRIIPKR